MTGIPRNGISTDDVRQILDLVTRSTFEDFNLSMGDFHLSVSKSGRKTDPEGPSIAPPAASPFAEPGSSGDAGPAKASALYQASVPASAPAGKAVPYGADEQSGLIDVIAPIVGIFYVAPEPGAKPFVEVGATVDADTTVGLIEVMKVFNGVNAEVSGTVVECLVKDSEFVEYGQALFRLRPNAA